MAFCTKCGTEFQESNQFCGRCGVARGSDAVAGPHKSRRWVTWLMLGVAGFVILLIAFGSQDSETKPPPKAAIASDQDLLSAYCKAIPDEDSDNGGIRADGKPWDLTDLAVDAPNQHNLFVLGSKSDLPHVGAALDNALRRQPADETISDMCTRLGQKVSSGNQSLERTMSEAILVSIAFTVPVALTVVPTTALAGAGAAARPLCA
jgi:hypothetical protein